MSKALSLDVLATIRDWVKGLIPTSLKNPYKLTINNTEYDGSAAVTMTIGGGGGGNGDMTKAVYDTDDDGYVDAVEDTLDPGNGIEFSLDANGKGQYRATGASTWIPFLRAAEETRLWINGAPGVGFAANTTIQLSESLANYDAVKILWAYDTGTAASISDKDNDLRYWNSCIETTFNLHAKKYDGAAYSGASVRYNAYFSATFYASSYAYTRRAYFPDANTWNQLTFTNALRVNSSGNNNGLVIPLMVMGVKYYDLDYRDVMP